MTKKNGYKNKPHQRTASYVALYFIVQNQIDLKKKLKTFLPAALQRAYVFDASDIQHEIHKNTKDIVLLQRHIRFLKVNHRRIHKIDRLPFASLEEMELVESMGRNISHWARGLNSVEKRSIEENKKVIAERLRLAQLIAIYEPILIEVTEAAAAADAEESVFPSEGFVPMECRKCGSSLVTMSAKGRDCSYTALAMKCAQCKTLTIMGLKAEAVILVQSPDEEGAFHIVK